jgi:hypothetical protein
MTCDEAERLIEAELDDILNAEEADRLRAHVAGCAGCARARREARRIAEAVAKAGGPLLHDSTWRALVSEAVARAHATRRARGVRTVTLLAAAAALLAACCLAWLHSRGPDKAGRRLPLVPQVATSRDATTAQTPTAAAARHTAGRKPPTVVKAPPPTPRRHRAQGAAPAGPGPGSGQARASTEGAGIAPIEALSAEDVALIYETALAFAREDGRLRAPMDMVAAARVQTDSGDLAAAIASYEAAVEASVRSPAPPIGAYVRLSGAMNGAPTRSAAMNGAPTDRAVGAEAMEEDVAPHLASEVLIARLSATEVIQR